MELLKQLLDEAAKKKPLKKAAKRVYHRDYEKTKNKPYRKYDAQDRAHEDEEATKSVCIYYDYTGAGRGPEAIAGPFPNETVAKKYAIDHEIDLADKNVFIDDASYADGVVTEGVWDFVKGAAGNIGGKIASGIKQGAQAAHAAGSQASASADLQKSLSELSQLLAQYDQLKGTAPAVSQQSPQQAPQQQAAQPATNASQSNANAVPAAFRQTQKPRAVPGKYGNELQFSSFLQTLDDSELLSEGIWDYVKGAGKQVGQSIAQPIRGAIAAGKEASSAADLQRVELAAKQKVAEIVKMLPTLGPQAATLLQQYATKLCGPLAARVVQVVQKAAAQMNPQAQT